MELLLLWPIIGIAAHVFMFFQHKIHQNGFGFFGVGGWIVMLFPASVAGPFMWFTAYFERPRT